MNSRHVRLTLVFPPALESNIVQILSSIPQAPGFTILRAEGHGHDFSNATTAEIVRGRIEQRVLWILTDDDMCTALLRTLKEQIPSTQVIWWIDALIDAGRLN